MMWCMGICDKTTLSGAARSTLSSHCPTHLLAIALLVFQPYIVLCWSILSYCREKSGLLVEKEACQPGPPLQSFHVSEWRNLESQVARSRSRLRGESWASYLAKVSRAHHLDLNPEHVRWEDLWKILTCGRCSRGIQAISSSALKGLERRVLHTLL